MTLTILEKIKAYKLEEVAADKAAKPIEAVEAEANVFIKITNSIWEH